MQLLIAGLFCVSAQLAPATPEVVRMLDVTGDDQLDRLTFSADGRLSVGVHVGGRVCAR